MTSLSPAYPAVPADALAIRLETPADHDWIENLHEVSFGPGRFARAAFRVRERFAADPSLCFIAELDGVRAASVRLTPIGVGGIDGYLLGPLMTDPAFRKQGAGRALVRHACEIALAREGVAFVLLVGDFAYYGPLGFEPTVPNAIRFPGPVDPARVLVHSLDANIAAGLAGDIGRFGKE
jgi:predicted N-acetyltransferase YhbS